MEPNLAESERNRLIINNTHIVGMVASTFRGGNVPYEELISRGHLALVEAARSFSTGNFPGWATTQIRASLIDLARSWKDLESPAAEYASDDSGEVERIYEWDAWGEDGNARAIHENWEVLGVSLGEVAEAFDKVADKKHRFRSAFMSLNHLERKLIAAVYLREMPANIASAAREYRISYKRAMTTIKNALETMRKVIIASENKKDIRAHSGRVVPKNRPRPRRPVANAAIH